MSYQGKNIIAIVQARIGSTRLPEKVLKNICGFPGTYYVIERVKRSRYIDRIALAIPDNSKNNKLFNEFKQYDINIYRGSEDDVVQRFVDCLNQQKQAYDYVVRVNADNFLICPEVIDECIEVLYKDQLDLINPFFNNTFPFGCGAEIAKVELLREIDKNANRNHKMYREHLFLYAIENEEKYKLDTINRLAECKYPNIDISVDTEDDYKRICLFMLSLPKQKHITFTLNDIISYFNEYSTNNHPSVINPAFSIRYNMLSKKHINKNKYLRLLQEVFYNVDPDSIIRNFNNCDNSTLFFVIEKYHRYIGLVFLKKIILANSQIGGIGSVCVKKEYRSNNYAYFLISRALKEASVHYPAVLLWTRIPSFFSKFGFQDASSFFEDDPSGSNPMLRFFDKQFEQFLKNTKYKHSREYF